MPQIGLQGMDCLKNQLETKRRINAFGPGCLGFLPRPLQSPYSSLNPLWLSAQSFMWRFFNRYLVLPAMQGGQDDQDRGPKGVHVTMPRRLIANLSLEGVLTFFKTAHSSAEQSQRSCLMAVHFIPGHLEMSLVFIVGRHLATSIMAISSRTRIRPAIRTSFSVPFLFLSSLFGFINKLINLSRH